MHDETGHCGTVTRVVVERHHVNVKGIEVDEKVNGYSSATMAGSS